MTVLVTFILIPLAIVSAGLLTLKLLKIREGGAVPLAGIHLMAFALGVIVFSYFWFILGVSGRLDLFSIYLFWFLTLVAVYFFRHHLLRMTLFKMQMGKKIWSQGWTVRILFSLIVLTLALTFSRLWSSYIEGDSLVYHLYLPKQFVMHQAIWAVPYSEHVFWPLLAEMAFIPGEILHSLVLSKWVTFLIYAGLTAMPGFFVYYKTKNLSAALVSAVLIVTCPVFFIHAPSTYNDIYFCFFILAAFLMLEMAGETKAFALRWFFLAGVLLGGSFACKHLGIIGLIALSPLLVYQAVKFGGIKQRGQIFLQFFIGLTLSGVPFYVRSFLQYGNPVFPFAQKIFGTHFGYGLEHVGVIGSNLNAFIPGAGRGFLDFLLLPFNLAVYPDLFGGDKLGFLFLLSLPIVFFAWRKNILAITFCLIYTAIWFSLSQYARYLIPVIAVVAGLIGLGAANFSSRFPNYRKYLYGMIILIAAIQTLWAGYHTYKDLFLRTDESSISVAQWFNQKIKNPKEKVLFIGEDRLYHFDFTGFREKTFKNFTAYPDLKSSVDAVRLLDREGVQFIAVARKPSDKKIHDRQASFDSVKYFDSLIEHGFYIPVGEMISGENISYTLYHREDVENASSEASQNRR